MKTPALFSALLLATCAAAPSENLVGKWRIQQAGAAAVNGGMTLEFKPDGLMFAGGGCNNASGGYRLHGSRLNIELSFTEKACAEPLMQLDAQLAEAAGQTASYRISGTQLEWLDGNGKTVLKARKAAP